MKEVGFDEPAKAAEALAFDEDEFEVADRLVAFGLVSPEAFEALRRKIWLAWALMSQSRKAFCPRFPSRLKIPEPMRLTSDEETTPSRRKPLRSQKTHNLRGQRIQFMSVRVHAIAKQVNKTSKEIVEILKGRIRHQARHPL